MNESPPIAEPEASRLPTMPLAARLMNVFATPGDVFEQVKAAARSSAANWLVPVVLACVVGIVTSVVMFSQPGIQQQIREEQAKAMDQQVKAGKMSQAQADQALAMAEKFTTPGVMMVFGAFGALFGSVGRVFWWALVLWLLGRWFLKARFGYMKTVEVAGLATMIAVLGAVVTMLLIASLGRLYATPSLALLVGEFDPKSRTHLLLGAANVFNVWLAGVMAVGLAKLAGVGAGKAAVQVFGFWVALELLLIFVGLGQFAL